MLRCRLQFLGEMPPTIERNKKGRFFKTVKLFFRLKFVEGENFMQSAKSLDEEILEYLPHLSGKQKQTVLTVVKTFVEDQEDWWDHISQEEQTAIEKALEEAEAGDFIPHDEVMKKYDKWRKK